MTNTNIKTEVHKIDNTTFGGVIYPSDYNTDYRGKYNIQGSVIAHRIIGDWNFDKHCKENREKYNNQKNRRK